MRHSLKEWLIKYLAQDQEWHPKGTLTDTLKWPYMEKGVSKTYLSETVGRALRQAESESRIAVKDDKNSKSIVYKFLPTDKRRFYIPWSMRKDKNIMFKP